MLETVASFLLKFALKEGLLEIRQVLKAAEDEKEACARDEAMAAQAVTDLEAAKSNEDLEHAFDAFRDALKP